MVNIGLGGNGGGRFRARRAYWMQQGSSPGHVPTASETVQSSPAFFLPSSLKNLNSGEADPDGKKEVGIGGGRCRQVDCACGELAAV